jgi:iron-sulfur cluster repair protein YtfE (RIC family)
MKRAKSIYRLSHDHHHALKAAQLIKKDAPVFKNLPGSTEGKVDYIINFYKEELIPHFYNEEEILFKIVKGRKQTVDLLIDEIKAEHKKISGLVRQLSIDENKAEILDKLGNLLSGHIRKEERILFPQIESILSEKESEQVSLLLENKSSSG